MRRADKSQMRRSLTVMSATALGAALVAPAASALPTPALVSAPVAVRAAIPAPTAAYLPGTRCPAFPATNYWHADVSRLKVHPRSAQWLTHMQAKTRKLHPDFGPSFGDQPVPYGIPITYVSSRHVKVAVRFDYSRESNRGPYPLGHDTRVEGGTWRSGDRHTIVVDTGKCVVYETWATHPRSGRWYAGSGAIWGLRSNALRPAGWTSADAAGLPILPGLLRWDEVARGRVDHAIRFTTNITDRTYVWPARHQAGSVNNRSYPPMGARFRLKASFNISKYPRYARVVLAAMKKYGLVLADNGSPWFFQGTSDSRWPATVYQALKSVPASAFEAVNTAQLRISSSSGASRRL